MTIKQKIIGILASACIALCSVLLATIAARADDIYLPDGTSETAVCTTFFSEPVYRVCQSKHWVCESYLETGQESCWMKPIRWEQ